MLIRRLRGLAISSLLWSVPWAGFGVLIGLAYELGLMPGFIVQNSGPAIPGGLPVLLGLTGAIIGGISGAVFGGALMLAERRRGGVGELRAWRVGACAAIASGGTILLLSGGSVIAAGICAAVGFGAGAGALRLAQRGAVRDTLSLEGSEIGDAVV